MNINCSFDVMFCSRRLYKIFHTAHNRKLILRCAKSCSRAVSLNQCSPFDAKICFKLWASQCFWQLVSLSLCDIGWIGSTTEIVELYLLFRWANCPFREYKDFATWLQASNNVILGIESSSGKSVGEPAEAGIHVLLHLFSCLEQWLLAIGLVMWVEKN